MKDGTDQNPTDNATKYFVGAQQIGFRRDNMDIVSPFSQGQISDWDVYEQLLNHALKSLHANPQEHPFLMSEPPHVSKSQRSKLCEIIFEKYSPPAYFVTKSPVLSAFSCGRTNATVVDCGASGIVVTAMHEGFCFSKSMQRSDLAGDALDRLVLHQLGELGINLEPSYAIKRRVNQDKLQIERLDFPLTKPSYRQFFVKEIARDLREACCNVRDYSETVPTPECYHTPQGSVTPFETCRSRAGDVLFNPSLLTPAERQATGIAPDANLRGLSEMVLSCISASDVDMRRELFNNVILCGGMSLFQGLQGKLQADLGSKTPHGMKLKLFSATPPERRFSAWIGGSILASLGSFHQIWISKAEYDEHGSKIIESKCP
eukprot:c1993_g1_i1.p1 GENE.c1993_g1_i1~~c1993_g1_i1.p1  ORF type:complete len:375 (+),score=74.55 c1993_g1_i1:246-1370(+)